jgi:hypothetical protein
VSVERVAHNGWLDCLRLSNGLVEAIIVPAIGRIMQFRLLGNEAGTFWENGALGSQSLESERRKPAQPAWHNFGGDKCWPAPQSEWSQQQGHGWPPPVAFDSQPMEATVNRNTIELASQIDPAYGIQIVRHIELEPDQPVMRIRNTYRKLTGPSLQVAVWTVTQMQEPECVAIRLPEKSYFTEGYLCLLSPEPQDLKIEGRLLCLTRHPCEFVKIGSDAASLAWIGSTCVVRIDAERGPGEYPDGGCVTEVYTNPDPFPYVELETMGPLATLHAGDQIDRTTIYTIQPRSTPDPYDEARNALRNL